MKVFLATKNPKKLNEMQRILSPLGIEVLSEINCDYSIDDVEENGATFEENAFIKANAACHSTGLPSLADDSGLCVDALNGAPGIYSARFSGEGHNDADNNAKLLNLLENTPDEKRTGRFVCAMCCVFPNGDTVNARGECEGTIARELKGADGFGYDPLFIHNGKTFGEMTSAEKDDVSHRGKATQMLVAELKKYLGEKSC